LVFKKSKRNPKRIEAVHLLRYQESLNEKAMAKMFNKKIKIRFLIIFKRALDFYLMKAQSRLR